MMSKSQYQEDEQDLEELIQSILDEEPGTCIKCGFKLMQEYKTKWDLLSTQIKLKCHKCGHTATNETKLLS